MTTINFKNGVQDGEAIAYDENGKDRVLKETNCFFLI